MTPAAPDVPKTAITTVERTGTTLTVISTVAFLGVLGYWLYAALTGNVSLTQDQLKATLTTVVIATIAAGAVALIATGLNLPGLRQPTVGRGLSTFFSGATLITAVLFLLLTALPHANVATFAQSFQDKCQTPLTKITTDIQAASTAAKSDPGSDATFAADMAKYSAIFQADSTAATSQYAPAVKALTPVQSKYQDAIDACVAEFTASANFLTGSQGITLPPPPTVPPPFGGQQLSAATLLQDAGALVLGQLPGVSQKFSAGLVSPLVSGVLDQAINTCDATCTHLKSDGAQLQTDAFTPFKSK